MLLHAKKIIGKVSSWFWRAHVRIVRARKTERLLPPLRVRLASVCLQVRYGWCLCMSRCKSGWSLGRNTSSNSQFRLRLEGVSSCNQCSVHHDGLQWFLGTWHNFSCRPRLGSCSTETTMRFWLIMWYIYQSLYSTINLYQCEKLILLTQMFKWTQHH